MTPRAGAERLAGLALEADGGVALKVLVTAAAEGGKANAALLKLLAKAWAVPRRDLALVLGAADRRKVVHVAGDPAVLLARLEASLAPQPPSGGPNPTLLSASRRASRRERE